MGKSNMPTVAFKIKTEDFKYLTRSLRDIMNRMIGDVENDLHEESLFEHNYYLIRSWIILCEAESQTITIKLDIMYAKSFVEYFKTVELPTYENLLLCNVIRDLDAGIINIEHKRRNRQL